MPAMGYFKIKYDDREKFLWLLSVGKVLIGKFRTMEGARNRQVLLAVVVEEVFRLEGG